MQNLVDLTDLLVILAVGAISLGVIVIALQRHNHSKTLQHRFGPDYERQLRDRKREA